MFNKLKLDNKVAVITGAAGGIGSASARLMAARGAKLVVADINLAGAEELAKEIGNGAIACHLDLADEQSIKEMIAFAIKQFGALHILHNNAADLSPETGSRDLNIIGMDTDIWDRVFKINVRGTMIACREALPHMLKNNDGVIINMTSSLALQGHFVQNAYSTSKAAIIQLTRNIAAAHGIDGIRSNSVAPGLTLTKGMQKAFPQEVKHLVEKETLRDQLGEPEDLAELIAFLASPAAININGQLLVSDGGCTTHVPDIDGYRQLGNKAAPDQ